MLFHCEFFAFFCIFCQQSDITVDRFCFCGDYNELEETEIFSVRGADAPHGASVTCVAVDSAEHIVHRSRAAVGNTTVLLHLVWRQIFGGRRFYCAGTLLSEAEIATN